MLASVCTLLLSLPCVREAETQGPAAFSPRTTSLSIVRAAKQADAAEERFFRRMEAEVCQDHSTGSNGFSPVSSPTRVCVRACVRAQKVFDTPRLSRVQHGRVCVDRAPVHISLVMSVCVWRGMGRVWGGGRQKWSKTRLQRPAPQTISGAVHVQHQSAAHAHCLLAALTPLAVSA
jgi:hypothetical protein